MPSERGPAKIVPHSPQNRRPGGFDAPHAEQVRAKRVPHSPQNFWSGSFLVPQFEQIIRPFHAQVLAKGIKPKHRSPPTPHTNGQPGPISATMRPEGDAEIRDLLEVWRHDERI